MCSMCYVNVLTPPFLLIQNVPTYSQVTKTKIVHAVQSVIEEVNRDFLKTLKPAVFRHDKRGRLVSVDLMRLVIFAGEVEHSAFEDKYLNSCPAILSKCLEQFEVNSAIMNGHI